MYNTGKPISEFFAEESKNTFKDIETHFGEEINHCVQLLNLQFSILEQTSWTFAQNQFSGRDNTEPALLSALHKGTFLFYSAIDLTRRGFYGPSNTLLRSIFESLILAKYIAVSPSNSVFETWTEGNQIHLTNHVFNRIKKPDIPELKILWKLLHQTTHATVYAQQVYLEYPEIKEEIALNFSLIEVLLCMNQHLLGTHFLTSSTIRNTRRYGNTDHFEDTRHAARNLTKLIRSKFSKSGKKIVREYCSTWRIKK